MSRNRPLTKNMRRVLVSLADGKGLGPVLPGRSAAGGFEMTLGALMARGLIEWAAYYKITAAGLAAIGRADGVKGQQR